YILLFIDNMTIMILTSVGYKKHHKHKWLRNNALTYLSSYDFFIFLFCFFLYHSKQAMPVFILYSFYCAGRTCENNSNEVEPRPNRGFCSCILLLFFY
ncbi:MAG: hypothetical protein LBG80_11400, partial [Bacteroidales bacterium]|nr:hypothetical protein [Bacteroidales bacterium]